MAVRKANPTKDPPPPKNSGHSGTNNEHEHQREGPHPTDTDQTEDTEVTVPEQMNTPTRPISPWENQDRQPTTEEIDDWLNSEVCPSSVELGAPEPQEPPQALVMPARSKTIDEPNPSPPAPKTGRLAVRQHHPLADGASARTQERTAEPKKENPSYVREPNRAEEIPPNELGKSSPRLELSQQEERGKSAEDDQESLEPTLPYPKLAPQVRRNLKAKVANRLQYSALSLRPV